MGGKSKSTTVGYWYKVLYHAGLGAGPIDAFLEFRGGDKPAWRGEQTSSGTISINAPFLWGGEKDQGGIVGDVDLMFGEASQAPNPYLLANLGPQVPAWRGLATLVFKGGKYGAMNPYPQKASYKIRKILKGWDGDVCWYPEKAAIPMTIPPAVALYFAIDLSGSMDEIASNGLSRLTNMKTALSAVLDQLIEAVAAGTEVDLMVVGFGTQPAARQSIRYLGATAGNIAAVKAWVNARTSAFWTYFTAGVMDMPTFFSDASPSAERMAFFLTDGEPSVSDASKTPLQIAQEAGAIVGAAGGRCYGINIDLADTTYTAFVDTTPEDGVPVVSGGDPSAIIGIIRGAIFGGVVGMNPAHALYYARTNSDIGREPIENLNDASYRSAADKLFAEGFGICTKYDPATESLEEFEQRIGKLIGGSVTRSLVDGQYYLDLARSDYVLEQLPILTDDDILQFSEQPSTLDGAINSVSVQYFDVDRKEEIATPPVQALGLIDAFGTIHQVNEYPEVPTASLAVRLADRDVRTTTTPTRALDLTTTRKPYDWRQNQYFRLQAPKRGIADMVCILGELSTGTLRSGAIKFKATQDIYNMSETTFVEVEPGVDTRPSQIPRPIMQQKVFEAPYVEAVQSMTRADLAALPTDVGYLLAVAADPAQSRDYTVTVAPDGVNYVPVATGDWCPTAVVVEGDDLLGHAPLTAFTLSSGQRLDQVELGTAALWGDEICRVDALDVATGAITLGRACADTVPAVHPAGSRIWFYDSAAAASTTEYTEGETVTVKLLTNTGSEQLPPAAAVPLPLEFKARLASPYPPGRFTVNGGYYPASAADTMVIDWVHRDREMQADQLIDTAAPAIGPEAGTTYTVRTYVDGVLYDTQAGVTAGPVSVAPTISGTARIELESERGTLVSWQKHVHELAYSYAGPPSPTTGVALPLTYDELDYNGLLTWNRQGGPLPTPSGAEFDGYQSRLKANASLPAWLSSSTGPLTVHATIAPFQAPPTSSGQAISVCTDDANYRPRLALACMPDSQDATLAQMVAMCYTSAFQTKRLCRREWRYEFRYPELSFGGKAARPQAVCFVDADTVLVTAHYEDTVSLCHRIRLSDGVVTGWFQFPSPYHHIAAIAQRADGTFWCGDYSTGMLLGLDIAASFASNAAVITTAYNCAAIIGFSCIDWVTVGEVEYLLAAEYTTTGSSPYFYVLPASLISNGGTFAVSSRTKRFVCSVRVQGVRQRGGKLYLSMNRLTADSAVVGKIQRYALDLTAADGSPLVAEDTWVGPGQYVEDIDFHPVTGHVWGSTEGCTAVGSDDGWLAYWSSPLDGSAVENTYTLEYNGAGSTRIKINGRLFEDIAWTPTPTPGCLVLGGRPVQAASWQGGYFSGTIRNVVVQENPMSAGEYGLAVSGFYEPNVLTTLTVSLTNPGAEAGDASGWTNEAGVLAVRTTNPLPHSGGYYFYDATSAATLARQRSAIPAAAADVDAGKAWARVRWYQATFSTGDDTSGMGMRFLDGTPAQISQHLAASIKIVPTMAWRYRTFAAAVPALTRNIDALIQMTRVSGTASDGYTDDITLTVYVQ